MKHKLPGFVDLQVNGYRNIDFGDLERSEQDLALACDGVIASGTAAFLPTVITAPMCAYEKNLPRLAKLVQQERFRNHLPGLHLEGPFLSPAPGAIGAHNPDYCQVPDPDALKRLQELADGQIKLLTIAAECPELESLCTYAQQEGICISLGHSMANAQEIDAAAAFGASALTHLGNGLPNTIDRHENPLWPALANDKLTAMIITDGHHLPPAVQKSFIRCKGVERIAIVSDAAPAAGMPPGHYDVLGNPAILEEDGKLHNPEKQCLVGSASMMLDCMNQLAQLHILNFDDMLRVSIENPLALIGLSVNDIDNSERLIFDDQTNMFSLLQ